MGRGYAGFTVCVAALLLAAAEGHACSFPSDPSLEVVCGEYIAGPYQNHYSFPPTDKIVVIDTDASDLSIEPCDEISRNRLICTDIAVDNHAPLLCVYKGSVTRSLFGCMTKRDGQLVGRARYSGSETQMRRLRCRSGHFPRVWGVKVDIDASPDGNMTLVGTPFADDLYSIIAKDANEECMTGQYYIEKLGLRRLRNARVFTFAWVRREGNCDKSPCDE